MLPRSFAVALLTAVLLAGCGDRPTASPTAPVTATVTAAPSTAAAAPATTAAAAPSESCEAGNLTVTVPGQEVNISGGCDEGSIAVDDEGTDGGTTAPPAQAGDGLPPGFPLPPGATVAAVGDDGRQIAATVTVSSAQEAFDFYLSALPGAGYTVTSSDSVNAGGVLAGEIDLTGNGFEGQIALAGTTFAIELDRQ